MSDGVPCTIPHSGNATLSRECRRSTWNGRTSAFLTRRLKNVRSEMALDLLAYNIKRMAALLGVRGLMRAMQV